MRKFVVAVVGASGVVGRTALEILFERGFPVEKLVLFTSPKSAGKTIEIGSEQHTFIELSPANVKKNPVDFAFFCAGGSVAREYAPIFASMGSIVIDNSSYFRMHDDVPLVVPEVNPQDVKKHKNIIANPNCSTIQAVVALKPLDDAFKIKRVVYSTYQAVSGAGADGVADLKAGIFDACLKQAGSDVKTPLKKFPYPIFCNALPHIDVFLEDGYTKEERKMVDETRKILGNDTLKICATCVRVGVLNGHSESINVEFEKPCTLQSVKDALGGAKGLELYDDVANNKYPMPILADGKDGVYVGRVRLDPSLESGVNLFVVSDNLRKGAALNAVQIAELIIKGE